MINSFHMWGRIFVWWDDHLTNIATHWHWNEYKNPLHDYDIEYECTLTSSGHKYQKFALYIQYKCSNCHLSSSKTPYKYILKPKQPHVHIAKMEIGIFIVNRQINVLICVEIRSIYYTTGCTKWVCTFENVQNCRCKKNLCDRKYRNHYITLLCLSQWQT